MTITQTQDQNEQRTSLPLSALQDWLASARAQSGDSANNATNQSDNTAEFWHIRENALESLASQGLPNGKKLERWKYSPLSKVWREHYFAQFLDAGNTAATANKNSVTEGAESGWIPENAIMLPIFEGKCAPADLAKLADIPGITLKRASALRDSALKNRLNAQLQDLGSVDGLCATTLALSPDTLVITLTEAFDAKRPLVIQHLKRAANHEVAHTPSSSSEASQAESADFTTFAIHLSSEQKLTVIEQYHAQPKSHGLKTVLNLIDLARGAQCAHLRLLTGHAGVQQHFYTRVHLDAHSQYYGGNYTVGSGFIRSVIEPQLSEPSAHCQVNGAYLASDKLAHHDHRIFVDHLSAHCTSESFVKGIAGKGATAVFNGRIHIAPGAKQSDGALQNRNLLLDNKSTVHTKPELEIYNDDVKCSHGATVSQLDHQQLLYLQSRGLDAEAAVHLLLESYLLETLQGLPEQFQAKGFKRWLISALDAAILNADAKEAAKAIAKEIVA